MKRLLTAILVLVAIPFGIFAQTGLEISQIFSGKYSSEPDVTETLMSGNQPFLRNHRLTTFATFKGSAAKYAPIIQPLILADGAHAKGRNVRYKDGKLHYAFLILPSIKIDGKKINRYVYYLNNSKGKNPSVMAIYFEGTINDSQAANLIETLINKH